MGRPTLFVLVVVAVVGSWFFLRDIPLNEVVPNNLSGVTANNEFAVPPFGRSTRVIKSTFPKDPRYLRVATFSIDLLERAKSENPVVLESLASILAQFDVIALQRIATNQSHSIGTIVDLMNASGLTYDYVVGPRVGRGQNLNQYAFVFDSRRVEMDRFELYTVDDPDDLLHWEPLVGWFRTKGVAPKDAFTFTLVNFETDPDERDRENAILSGIFREVRNDKRGEDDVILLGHFRDNAGNIARLSRLPDPCWAVTDIATDTQATGQYDNIVCCRHFTDEVTGRSGVYDFLRQMNLSLEQAQQVSLHLPVWAEFTMREGGDQHRVASQPAPQHQEK